ncbi:MAG: thiamine-phosphate kinase [Cyclobacteriaceae bacterium]
MSDQRSEISNLGEFGLIRRQAERIELNHPTTVKGIGDDSAVVRSGDKLLLLTTDMLLEGIHFDLRYVPLRHLGYKSIAVNVSDIAAMNGKPAQALVSLAISNRFSLEAVDELYEGMRLACKEYGVDLVGGDTSSSASGLMISVTLTGFATPDKVVYRSGAGNNDIICVTGDLGGAYAGLQVLEREKEVFLSNPEAQPDLQKSEYVVGRQLKPEARMDIIHEFEELNLVPTSMIDISDGLASELFHLGAQSGMGVKIFEDKIPIDHQTYETAVEFRMDPITFALNGGEDYELLFTVKQLDLEKIKNHPDIHLIGHMHAAKGEHVMITKAGHQVMLKAQGWTHF